jgi:DNA-binding NtrC family response regulator
VLLVGDDVSVTDALSRELRFSGCEVWACTSAADGLALARTHRPQVLLVDLRTTLAAALGLASAVNSLPSDDLMPVEIVMVTGDYRARPAPEELATLRTRIHYRPVWLNELLGVVRNRLPVPATR